LATTALRVVLFVTTKLAAGVPLNETALALVKLVPVIITLVPGTPWFGVKLVMVGAT